VWLSSHEEFGVTIDFLFILGVRTSTDLARIDEAVAAWQQDQFVGCSVQLTYELAVVGEVLIRNEGNAMRIFMAFAITITAAIGLGGCFWHHQAAVVTQPAPPLK